MAILQRLIDDRVFPLNLSQLGIGRATDNEIVIDDDAVSSYHALITVRESPGDSNVMDYILEDLDSTNSTFVNNKAVKQHKLVNGDIVRVGETRLKFLSKEVVDTPKEDFQKTRKLGKNKLASIVGRKWL
jgi:pSer/pThr/pTyr-binding forkhead associated (FHA) protein